MNTLRAWAMRVAGLFGHEPRDHEFDAELESHVELATEENLRSGMSAEEARRRALVQLGGIESAKESYRDRRSVPWIEHLFQDVRYGIRILLNSPSYTCAALLALALGIGANTALFSVVYSVLLRPLPYADADHLVVLQQRAPGVSVESVPFSVKEIEDYRAQMHSVDQLEEYHGMYFILLGRQPDRVQTGVVSHGFFSLLGVKPLRGRLFQASDDTMGAPPVLVLSYAYWQRAFGGDPDIIGKAFKMNDRMHTVVGVLPPIPQYPRENDVYMPISSCPFRSNPSHLEDRGMRMMRLFGHLKPGVSLATAQQEMHGIAAGLQRDYPKFYPSRYAFDATAFGLEEQITQRARPMLILLLGVTGLVLLICCTNVANLALARIVRREHEFAVRAAVGASPGRLIRQVLTESTLLALAGGALGLLLASSAMSVLVRFVGLFTTRAAEVQLSAPVLLFTLALSLLTSILFGSMPALTARRGMSGLKMGITSTARAEGDRFRSALIVAEITLSFVMLTAAGLMVRTLLNIQTVNAGYNPDNAVAMRLPFDWSKYNSDDKTRAYEDRILGAVSQLPGITAAALTSSVPLDESQPNVSDVVVDGQPNDASQPRQHVNVMQASPETFRTLGVPVLCGRSISPDDRPDKPQVAVVSQSLAQHFWGKGDPIGHRLSSPDGKNSVEIVGVVGDVRQYGLDHSIVDTVYVPLAQSPGGGSLVLRARGDPLSLVDSVRNTIRQIDPEQAIVDVSTLDELRNTSILERRVTTILLGLFGLLALVIAVTGLAGVTAFLVSRRTREIGIRIALGADVRDVLAMVLRRGVRLLVIGTVVGACASLAVGRALQKLLFEVKPIDVLTLVAVSVVVLGASLVASYIPARRATRVDPMVALRCD